MSTTTTRAAAIKPAPIKAFTLSLFAVAPQLPIDTPDVDEPPPEVPPLEPPAPPNELKSIGLLFAME